MAKSRLAEILEYERRGGTGSLEAIVSALRGRLKERADIRGRFFGREGTTPTGLAQSLGRAIFGAGYSATERTGRRYTGAKISRVSPSVSMTDSFSSQVSPSVSMTDSFSSQVMVNMDDKLAKIDKKMEIIAKNTMAQNRVARDINVMRQNIQLMAKSSTGKVRHNADMYFMNVKQREADYERKFGKTPNTVPVTTTPNVPTEKDKKESGFNLFGLAKGFLKGAALGGAVYTIFKTVEGLVNIFKQIESFISGKIQPFMSSLLDWKKSWDNFNLENWIKSITPDQLGSVVNSITNFFKESGSALSNEAAKLISKIPADSLGNLINVMVDNFFTVIKAVGSKLSEAFSTMNTDDLLKAATAGGLLAMLFGGGPSLVGGLLGKFLSSSLSSLSGFLVANPMAAAGILAALGLAKATKNILESDLSNPEANIPKIPAERDKFAFTTDLNKQFDTNLSQENLLTKMRNISPAYEQQFSGLINQYNQAGEGNQRKAILEKMRPYLAAIGITSKDTDSTGYDEKTGRWNVLTTREEKQRGKALPELSIEQFKSATSQVERMSSEPSDASQLTGKAGYDYVYNYAKQKGDKFPELVAAQWAIESAWGTKPSGKNNFFGQKAGKNEAGTIRTTQENENGKMVTIQDKFKDFNSLDESIDYRIKQWSGVYQDASSLQDAVAKLRSSGYFTADLNEYSNLVTGVVTGKKPESVTAQVAGLGGDLSAAASKVGATALAALDKAEDVIINLYNNFVNAAQSQQAQADVKLIQDALGSMDSEAIKDFMNPMMMKYTLSSL